MNAALAWSNKRMSETRGEYHTGSGETSATPDTDRLPQWDDQGWDAYLYAVDLDYRVDWDLSHGVPRDEVRAMIDDWEDSHESDDDEEDDEW